MERGTLVKALLASSIRNCSITEVLQRDASSVAPPNAVHSPHRGRSASRDVQSLLDSIMLGEASHAYRTTTTPIEFPRESRNASTGQKTNRWSSAMHLLALIKAAQPVDSTGIPLTTSSALACMYGAVVQAPTLALKWQGALAVASAALHLCRNRNDVETTNAIRRTYHGAVLESVREVGGQWRTVLALLDETQGLTVRDDWRREQQHDMSAVMLSGASVRRLQALRNGIGKKWRDALGCGIILRTGTHGPLMFRPPEPTELPTTSSTAFRGAAQLVGAPPTTSLCPVAEFVNMVTMPPRAMRLERGDEQRLREAMHAAVAVMASVPPSSHAALQSLSDVLLSALRCSGDARNVPAEFIASALRFDSSTSLNHLRMHLCGVWLGGAERDTQVPSTTARVVMQISGMLRCCETDTSLSHHANAVERLQLRLLQFAQQLLLVERRTAAEASMSSDVSLALLRTLVEEQWIPLSATSGRRRQCAEQRDVACRLLATSPLLSPADLIVAPLSCRPQWGLLVEWLDAHVMCLASLHCSSRGATLVQGHAWTLAADRMMCLMEYIVQAHAQQLLGSGRFARTLQHIWEVVGTMTRAHQQRWNVVLHALTALVTTVSSVTHGTLAVPLMRAVLHPLNNGHQEVDLPPAVADWRRCLTLFDMATASSTLPAASQRSDLALLTHDTVMECALTCMLLLATNKIPAIHRADAARLTRSRLHKVRPLNVSIDCEELVDALVDLFQEHHDSVCAHLNFNCPDKGGARNPIRNAVVPDVALTAAVAACTKYCLDRAHRKQPQHRAVAALRSKWAALSSTGNATWGDVLPCAYVFEEREAARALSDVRRQPPCNNEVASQRGDVELTTPFVVLQASLSIHNPRAAPVQRSR